MVVLLLLLVVVDYLYLGLVEEDVDGYLDLVEDVDVDIQEEAYLVVDVHYIQVEVSYVVDMDDDHLVDIQVAVVDEYEDYNQVVVVHIHEDDDQEEAVDVLLNVVEEHDDHEDIQVAVDDLVNVVVMPYLDDDLVVVDIQEVDVVEDKDTNQQY